MLKKKRIKNLCLSQLYELVFKFSHLKPAIQITLWSVTGIETDLCQNQLYVTFL